MNRFLTYLFCLFLLASCNMHQKRIVSKTPVKSNIMGVELCAETSADEIVSTISEETGKIFLSSNRGSRHGNRCQANNFDNGHILRRHIVELH